MFSSDIDAELVKVEEISKIHNVSDFDCSDSDLNEFLKKDSLKYKAQFIAKTFIIVYKEQVVAFFSVLNDAIKLKSTETEKTPDLKRLHEYPAIKIGRIGVDKRFKGKGFGNFIINFMIGVSRSVNQVSACRFLTVDSYPNAIPFYEKHGFIKNLMYQKKKDFISMRLDIIDLI